MRHGLDHMTGKRFSSINEMQQECWFQGNCNKNVNTIICASSGYFIRYHLRHDPVEQLYLQIKTIAHKQLRYHQKLSRMQIFYVHWILFLLHMSVDLRCYKVSVLFLIIPTIFKISVVSLCRSKRQTTNSPISTLIMSLLYSPDNGS